MALAGRRPLELTPQTLSWELEVPDGKKPEETEVCPKSVASAGREFNSAFEACFLRRRVRKTFFGLHDTFFGTSSG